MGKVKVRFKDYLEDHGLSAYRVSKYARGMSPKTVYAIASGRHRPSMERYCQILWIGFSVHAATFSSVPSTSSPFLNSAPALTSATR